MWNCLNSTCESLKSTIEYICFVVHATLGANYFTSGDVVDVLYGDTEFVKYPCYIAIRDESSEWDLHFHGTSNTEMCKFAQDCKFKGVPITMHAVTSNDHNQLISVQFADTKALL